MKRFKILYILIFFITISIASCEKHNDDDINNQDNNENIDTPDDNDSIPAAFYEVLNDGKMLAMDCVDEIPKEEATHSQYINILIHITILPTFGISLILIALLVLTIHL